MEKKYLAMLIGGAVIVVLILLFSYLKSIGLFGSVGVPGLELVP